MASQHNLPEDIGDTIIPVDGDADLVVSGIGINQKAFSKVFVHIQMGENGEFHRHGQMVRTVEQSLGHDRRHRIVAVLVDALVEMPSVVAHSMERFVKVFDSVEAHVDLVRHQDEVETVVQTAAREAFIGIPSRGLGVEGSELDVAVPLAHATGIGQRIHKQHVGIAVSPSE